MSRLATRAKWAAKLARTRNFIVLTDTESAINIRGMSPDNFDDIFTVSAQAAALQQFRAKLDQLIVEFDKEVAKKFTPKKKRQIKVKAPKSKATKINVTTK